MKSINIKDIYRVTFYGIGLILFAAVTAIACCLAIVLCGGIFEVLTS